LEVSATELSPIGVRGIPGGGVVSYAVRCMRRSGGGAPVPLRLNHIWECFEVPFWQETHPAVWF